jgi:hypothetical protein
MLRNAVVWCALGAIAACDASATGQTGDPTQGSGAGSSDDTGSGSGSGAANPNGVACATSSAQGVWANRFVSQQYGDSQEFGWIVYPSEASNGPIDAVMGLANGPASAFTDLGPIVRFNADGYIDARDGDAYRAERAVPYVTDGNTQYLFQLSLDYNTHTYTASVFAGYSNNEIVIGTNYNFRSEQSGMTRADTYATEVDSATGSIRSCYPGGSLNWLQSSAGSGWGTIPFRREAGNIEVVIEAEPENANIDAVIGLAAATPSNFTDLAAIGRFSPAGVIDARDGGAYRADVSYPYSGYHDYEFIFDVNIPASTYSLTVLDEGTGAETVIARDYAFRSEQTGVGSLAALGQYVDGTSGTLVTDRLIEKY